MTEFRRMKVMTVKRTRRLLTLLLTLMMVFAYLPQMSTPVYADEKKPAMNLVVDGASANIEGAQKSSVYFGHYRQSSDGNGGYREEPVKYRVLSNYNSEKRLLLLSDMNLDGVSFNDKAGNVKWGESTLRKWLNEQFTGAAFTGSELSAITGSGLDKVFVLSVYEATGVEYGFTLYGRDPARQAKNTDYAKYKKVYTDENGNGSWWLRTNAVFPSVGERLDCAMEVYSDGDINRRGPWVDNNNGVRPAFYIDLKSVLFTSAAEGGKVSGLTGVNTLKSQSELFNSTNEWKLTVRDDAHKAFSVSKTTFMKGLLTVTYKNAAIGTGEYISAIITDKPITDPSAKIKFYGRIRNCVSSDDKNGTVKINTKDKLGANDNLYVFNEQCNGDKQTDYAGELIKIDTDPFGKGASKSAVDKAMTASSDEGDAKGSEFHVLRAKTKKVTDTSVTLGWTRVKNARKYVVYGNMCNTKNKKNKYIRLGSTAGTAKTVSKINKIRLRKGTYYKFRVVALDKNNKVISTSKTIHAATSGGKFCNAGSVKTAAKNNKIIIKKNKIFKLKGSEVRANRNLRSQLYRKVAYESSDPKIATVSKAGAVKGRKKGTCYIYAYAQNGTFRKIKVTVKA